MTEPPPKKSDRADRLLVALGHFESRAAARAAIEAGMVKANGEAVTKPAQMISPDAQIEAAPAHPWVSRGGVKLAHALDVFGVDPAGQLCLDVGASTGGFTDVLLTRGAATVVAVDVGHSQLHPRLIGDPRVISLEGRDARTLEALDFSGPPTLIVCDASFISLAKILERALSLAPPNASLIALFKPQFEVGPDHVGKGGIVSDTAAIERAADALNNWLNEKGWPVLAWTASPILGGDGNAERLLLARKT